MGWEYRARLAVGYAVNVNDLKKAFGIKVRGKFHWERRWDPKTGAEMNQIKVTDQAPGLMLRLPSEDKKYYAGMDTPEDDCDILAFLERLCEVAQCEYTWPDMEEDWFVLGYLPDDSDNVYPDEVRRLLRTALPLGPRLENLNLQKGRLEVHALLYRS